MSSVAILNRANLYIYSDHTVGPVNEKFSGGLKFGIVNLFALLIPRFNEKVNETREVHTTSLNKMSVKSQHIKRQVVLALIHNDDIIV